ncbi:MAG: FtsW/RodA/SpoVE family cell cycle protein, partial [Gammaproteobacteria bacterium]
SQAQLGFLPERHTDFIFAVYAEEFGLVGSAGLLTLTLLITWRCLLIAGRAKSRFGHLATAGITAIFFMTMSINLCMVSGLLPVVGMPLPLISYGGTALIATFAGFGLILAVARR